jgi:hypothetical protein
MVLDAARDDDVGDVSLWVDVLQELSTELLG